MSRTCRLTVLCGLLLAAGCTTMPQSTPTATPASNLSSDQRAQVRSFLTTPSARQRGAVPMDISGAGPLPCDGDAVRCGATIEVGIIRRPLEPGLEGLEALVGTCYAIMPYERINVSKPNPHRTQSIEWTLVSVSTKDGVDVKDFEFCRQTGSTSNPCNFDGIEFLPPDHGRLCSHARTDDDFDSPDHGAGGNKKKFRWRNKHDPGKPGASFCHQANVRPDKSGIADVVNGRCLQPDPLIVNQ